MLKKVLALALAGAMVLGSMSAFAATGDPGKITVIPSSTVTLQNKTLKAYKILNATYGTEGTLGGNPGQAVAYTIPASMTNFFNNYKEFADVTGNTVTKTAAEKAAEAGKTLDVYVADIMKEWGDDSAKIKDFTTAALVAAKAAGITAITGVASGNNVEFRELAAGYYVIEDEGQAVPISALMLDTVTNANVNITLKASDESEKEIMTSGDLVNSKANELGLGRDVNYKVSQKIPDTTGYDYYYYMINDTLSAGLTFNPDSLVVKVGGQTLQKGTDYYLYADKTADAAVLNGKTFIVAFNDVVQDIKDKKYAAGAAVEVTYTATVNSDAIVGVDPNNNKVNVEFSNNPDKDGRGDFENHPGIPANDGNHPTGVGPDKWTDTYTTQVTIYKTDGTTQIPLSGVEFTLTGTAKDAVFQAWEVYDIDPDGDYWLLKDGTYTTRAPQTLPTLQETTGGAGWVEDDSYDKADARVVNGHTYRPYVEATDSAKTRYIINEPNEADYTSTTTKYKKNTVSSDDAAEYTVGRTGLTGADGYLNFAQLGAGSYVLTETGVLAGYNGIKEIPFSIACTLPPVSSVIAGNEKASWVITTSAPGVRFIQGSNAGVFQINLENNKGVELPSTGGIGTTIFYIGGAVLVLLAGVLLVSKRRIA